MEKKEAAKEKIEEILKKLKHRKEIRNAKIQFATSNDTTRAQDVMGNVASCTDEICGGGIGNVAACDDQECSDPDAEPDTMGNTSACGDWICD